MTNPAGSAIVNTIGQIRQAAVPGSSHAADKRRYLVIAPKVSGKQGAPCSGASALGDIVMPEANFMQPPESMLRQLFLGVAMFV